MLSDGYWRSRFGGNRSVLGRRILLDGNTYAVIGVLPPSFEFMDREILLLVPFRVRRTDVRLINFCCQGVARLKPGVTLIQANADVARMLPIAAEKFPINPGWTRNAFTEARIAPRLRPLKDGVISYSVSQRTREVGIRLALGAPIHEVMGLFLRQGLAMSAMGTVCGLAAALILTRLMKSLLFEVSPSIR